MKNFSVSGTVSLNVKENDMTYFKNKLFKALCVPQEALKTQHNHARALSQMQLMEDALFIYRIPRKGK